MERIARSGDDMLVLYTDGTTGMPKGVMWRQGVAGLGVYLAAFPRIGLDPPESVPDLQSRVVEGHDRGVAPIHVPAPPLMHGTGLASSSAALSLGGTLVTLTSRHFDAHELWQTVERRRVNRIAIVGDPFA